MDNKNNENEATVLLDGAATGLSFNNSPLTQPGMPQPQMPQPGMANTVAPQMNMGVQPGMPAPGMAQQAAPQMNMGMHPGMPSPGMAQQAMPQMNMSMQPGMPQAVAPKMDMQPGMPVPGMAEAVAPKMDMQPGMSAPGMAQQAAPQMNMGMQSGMPDPGMAQQAAPQMNMGMQSGMPAPGMAQQAAPQPGMPQGGQFGKPQGGKIKKVKAPKVKAPMTGGKIAAIIGASTVGVAGIVAGIIFIPKLFKPAKDVVVDAFKTTFVSESSEPTYIAEITGSNEIMDTYYSDGGSIDMSFSIEEIEGDTSLSELDFVVTDDYDPINKIVNYSLGLNYEGNELAQIRMIGDEEYTYFELVDGINAYLSHLSLGNRAKRTNQLVGHWVLVQHAPHRHVHCR